MKTVIIFLLIVLNNLAPGICQSPNLISYQAIARHSDGSVISNSTIGIQISILEGSDKGTNLYSEKHQVTTNQFGLFTLPIGQGQSNKEFSAINWNSGKTKWIQIKIDLDNSGTFILMGASQLLSVPYALFANQAGSAPLALISMTDEERDAMKDPLNGQMILNTTTNSLNIRKDGDWWESGLTKIIPEWRCGKPYTDTRDGKSYRTALIGIKCWMAENLNFGQMVDLAARQSDNGTIEKFCYDNSSANCQTYGGLYMWDEAMGYTNIKGAQGICPDGWHIPTDLEWQEMEIALGMSQSDALKANTWRGTDQGTKLGPGGGSGYDALYSGRSVPGFGFTALGSYEYMWTSNESGINAWRRCLDVSSPQVGRYDSFPKTYGMSLRCIR